MPSISGVYHIVLHTEKDLPFKAPKPHMMFTISRNNNDQLIVKRIDVPDDTIDWTLVVINSKYYCKHDSMIMWLPCDVIPVDSWIPVVIGDPIITWKNTGVTWKKKGRRV